ncbi:MAG: peptidylprolyl isomerase [Rhodocyclaceae bacterium]|jgi:peptidyl-prolyl cis-trans isomerase D|nr:peptidylprolyl isomerase [Rhodocyclaceae bacterium]
MFDAIRNNKRIVQIFLVAITLPFAFWGVESYVRNVGTGGDAASVGGSKISQQELAQALRDQQERMRGALGREFNPAMFDTPEARQAILDSLVTQRLLLLHAGKSNLTASDDQLRLFLGAIPALQEDGKFSMRRYEQVLRTQGLTQAGFEAKLRQDLTLQQLVSAVADTSIVSREAAERVLAVQLEEREVSEAAIFPDKFAGLARIDAEAVKSFYEKNRKMFETPEQVRAEFVVLNLEALAQEVAVSEDEIKGRYEANAARYKQAEERRASHILIQVPKDAPEADQKAARAKIDSLLQQVKKNPNDFAGLAQEHSQDPGSGSKGGDLGFFPRGTMVKPFEDAVFSMKENQTSDVVRSDFGFHIIRLTGIRAEKGRAFNEVRAEIANELKAEAAAKKFAEAAEGFSNMVYEQADSLKPAAEKYKLALRQTGFFDRTNRAAAAPLGGNDKLVSALFSEDAIKNKRNTEAVEVAANTLIAARVLEHRPAELRPLDAVKSDIEKKLAAEEAAKLAQKEGEAKLALLAKGENAGLSWSPAQTVLRQGMRGLPPEGLKAIFKAPSDKLPSHAGVQLPGGAYVIYRVSEVRPGKAKEGDPRAKAQAAQLAQLSGSEDFNAYLVALKARYPVEINKAALEAKERQ